MGVLPTVQSRAGIPTSTGVGMAIFDAAMVVSGFAFMANRELMIGVGLLAGAMAGGALWSHFVEYKARELEFTHMPAQTDMDGYRRMEQVAQIVEVEGLKVFTDFDTATDAQVVELARRVVEKRNYKLTYDALRQLGGWPIYKKDGTGRNTAIDKFRTELVDRHYAVRHPNERLEMTGEGKKFFRELYKQLPH